MNATSGVSAYLRQELLGLQQNHADFVDKDLRKGLRHTEVVERASRVMLPEEVAYAIQSQPPQGIDETRELQKLSAELKARCVEVQTAAATTAPTPTAAYHKQVLSSGLQVAFYASCAGAIDRTLQINHG